jgi:hypothetical protein
VPDSALARARTIAGIAAGEGMPAGDWELTQAQSQEIARLICAPLDARQYDCFLEPYVLAASAAPG